MTVGYAEMQGLATALKGYAGEVGGAGSGFDACFDVGDAVVGAALDGFSAAWAQQVAVLAELMGAFAGRVAAGAGEYRQTDGQVGGAAGKLPGSR